MSHFTVLVVGDDCDSQLAPFHEFECTGIDDEYVVEVDKTAEAEEKYKERGKGESFAKFVHDWYGLNVAESVPDLSGEHKYGYVRLGPSGEVLKVVDRTNPNKKWDWYQVGGRWSGFFKLKPTAFGHLGEASLLAKMSPEYAAPGHDRADSAFKRDIDFEGMRQAAAEAAQKTYDLFKDTVTSPITPWEVIRAQFDDANINAARDLYHAQVGVKQMRSNKDLAWLEPSEFACTREEYIDRARRRAISTFAVVKDGKWFERGSMGWWGFVSDEKDSDEWESQFSDLLDGLPDDVLLTVVDCHI